MRGNCIMWTGEQLAALWPRTYAATNSDTAISGNVTRQLQLGTVVDESLSADQYCIWKADGHNTNGVFGTVSSFQIAAGTSFCRSAADLVSGLSWSTVCWKWCPSVGMVTRHCAETLSRYSVCSYQLCWYTGYFPSTSTWLAIILDWGWPITYMYMVFTFQVLYYRLVHDVDYNWFQTWFLKRSVRRIFWRKMQNDSRVLLGLNIFLNIHCISNFQRQSIWRTSLTRQ